MSGVTLRMPIRGEWCYGAELRLGGRLVAARAAGDCPVRLAPGFTAFLGQFPPSRFDRFRRPDRLPILGNCGGIVLDIPDVAPGTARWVDSRYGAQVIAGELPEPEHQVTEDRTR